MSQICHPQAARQREQPYRNRKWLDYVRTMPCIVTGLKGDDIDPAHLGTFGRGIKEHDYHVLPLTNELHALQHIKGEASFWRQYLPDDVLMDALRLYARHRVFEQTISSPIERNER